MGLPTLKRLAAAAGLAACVFHCDPALGQAYRATPSYALGDSLWTSASGNTHSPYLLGSHFSLWIETDMGPDGWTLVSSDPGVVHLQASQNELQYSAIALAVGHSTLVLRDGSGKVLTQQEVEVSAADGIQIWAPGPLRVGLVEAEAPIATANVLQGGARFLVRYFAGTQELAGNGADLTSAGGATISKVTPADTSDVDWVVVDGPAQAGQSGSVTLTTGTATDTVSITTVADSDIAELTVTGQSESGASDGESLCVLARARDATGADVFGGSYTWVASTDAGSIDPIGGGSSEVACYEYDAAGSETMRVAFEGQSASLSVHGVLPPPASSDPGDCAVGPGPGRVAWPASLALACIVFAVRRARRFRATSRSVGRCRCRGSKRSS